MKAVSILLRVLAIAGAIVAAVGWVMTNNKVDEITAEKQRAHAQANDARSQASDLEEKLRGANSKASALESELSASKAQANNFRAQVVEAQRDANAIRTQLTEARNSIQTLETQNTGLKEEIIGMRTAVPEATDNEKVNELEDKVASLTRENNTLRDRLTTALAGGQPEGAPRADGTAAAAPRTGETAEATGTAATPRGPGSLRLDQSGLKATLLRADLDNGLIVIARGSDEGMRERMEFGVAQGFSAPIRVRVARTGPDFSLAHVLPTEGRLPPLVVGEEIVLIQ